MRWAMLIGCWFATACGRIGFEGAGDDTTGDGQLGDGRLGDGQEIGLGDCWSAWRAGTVALSAPQLVPNINTTEELEPSTSATALELYFVRGAVGARDIYVAKRPDRSSQFGTPMIAADVSSPQDEGRITFTDGGVHAVWTSNRIGTVSNFDLWESTRATTSDLFPGPSSTAFTQVNLSGDQFDPQLSSDGLRVYYTLAVTMNTAVWVASRPSPTVEFGSRGIAITSPAINGNPSLSPDELVMAYAGKPNQGSDLDLYYATRASTSDAFSNFQLVPGANTAVDDLDPAYTFDGCELFFSSLRSGNSAIYVSVLQ